ncbi:MAG: class I SAM-dependent methyltransferase [Patescibacteria group bacterium]
MITNASFKNINSKKVINYYKNLESRLGYTFLTWDTKHFGYYPSKKRDISEREAQTLMIELLAKKLQLKKSDLVLDAGCGRGTTTCYLVQKYGCKLVGIDIVDFELEIAKKRAKRFNLKEKVNFYLKDYSNTKFPDNHFDKVFTLETLVHSPDFKKTLEEFYRVLKHKGRLALFEYTISPLKEWSDYNRKMLNIINTGSAMMSLDKMFHKTFKNDIIKTGFKIISDTDITDFMKPSLERFYKYAKIPYIFIKFFNLQKYFINTTAGVEFNKMGLNGLVKYRIFVAEKI